MKINTILKKCSTQRIQDWLWLLDGDTKIVDVTDWPFVFVKLNNEYVPMPANGDNASKPVSNKILGAKLIELMHDELNKRKQVNPQDITDDFI